MANENIGTINCELHSQPLQAFVRMDKRKKFYIYCTKCGLIAPKAHTFQDFIKENAVMYASPKLEYEGGGKPVKPSENPEPLEIEKEIIKERKAENFTPAPKEIPKKQPQKMSGLLSGVMNILGSEE